MCRRLAHLVLEFQVAQPSSLSLEMSLWACGGVISEGEPSGHGSSAVPSDAA